MQSSGCSANLGNDEIEPGVSLTMIVGHIARIGDNRIGRNKAAQRRIIPASAVEVQPQPRFFSLPGVAEGGGRRAGGEPGGAKGPVAYLAGFGGSLP
jgi:hypothetical protein